MMTRRQTEKILAYVGLVLCVAQVFVIIISWILSAVGVSGTHSLLGAEGIRWFFGHFVDNMRSPILVWLLVISIAVGSVRYSSLSIGLTKLCRRMPLTFRERIALRLVFVELFVFTAFLMMLTLVPHAILLSATGDLFPSSFSASLIPSLSFIVCFVSVSYGVMSGRVKGMDGVFRTLTIGIVGALPFWIYYILIMELYCSVRFSFLTV